MDLEGIILSEISQTEKDKYHTISLICGMQKKKKPEKQTHRYREHLDGCPMGGVLDGVRKKRAKDV